jgi:predicted dehydrogenase
MTRESIGVAVIGAGMAGRAHAAGYRSAGGVFDASAPGVRLVAIADINDELAEDTRRRYGFERAEHDWRAIVESDDVDAVSVVVANHLHREVIEALLSAGKHVLCEKPLAPSVADAQAMVDAAARHDRVAALGYTYRWSPAINAIRREIDEGDLGRPVHFNGHAWYGYAFDQQVPMTWRYRGGPGSGVLADVGSHIVDTAEMLCGPVIEVSGASFVTAISSRPVPAGATVGHGRVETTGEMAQVDNEDVAVFTARFENGAIGSFSASRIAHAEPNGLGFEVFCTGGSATFDVQRMSEFQISDGTPREHINGRRRVYVGPEHPYIAGGIPMDALGVGHGLADLFVFQARAFLDEIAGNRSLPRCPSFADGLHSMEVLEAVTTSATNGGVTVTIPTNQPQRMCS